ncbi:MAG: FG-GAP-like repeat-containing protein, partial [Acidobacteriota bacterium]
MALAAAEPDPRPSSFYGTVSVGGQPVADGTKVSASLSGGQPLVVTSTFTVDGESVYRLDVPGDISVTPEVEGGLDGQAVRLLIEGSPAPEEGVWGDGLYTRLDLTANPGADLSILLDDSSDQASPGDVLIYTLSVDNPGSIDAAGVLLENVLPAGTEFVSASDGGAFDGAAGIVSWPDFDLAAGTSAARTLTVRVLETLPPGTTSIENVATVRSNGADGIDPDSSNNRASDFNVLIGGGPDLVVAKSADLTLARPGDDIIYTLTVRNDGRQDALGVVLTDTLPAEVIFLSASGDGRSEAGVVTWPAVNLAIGEQLTRTITVRLDPATAGASQLVNVAEATSVNGPDLAPADNVAENVLPIAQQTDLVAVAVDPAGAVVDSQSLTLTGSLLVDVRNGGTTDALALFDVAVFEDLDGDGAFGPVDNVLGTVGYGGGVLVGETVGVEVPVTGAIAFRNNLLYAFVDSTDSLAELDETNNVEHSARGCESAPTVGDFDPVVELSWPLGSTEDRFSADVLSTPLVVQLTDDNGDGRRDERDIPDLVFTSIDLTFPLNPAPRLRAIRGDTGDRIFDALPPASSFLNFSLTGMAAADIDLDGRPEIIVSVFDFRGPTGRPNRIAAYEHNGALKWISAPYSTHPDGDSLTNRDNPTIADLDRDGVPEILVGANVFNNNGTIRWRGTGGQAYQSAGNRDGFDSGAISIAADLDLSGDLEVVTGNTAYRADGSIYWQVPLGDGYPAVGNFDADDFPEIVVVSRGTVRLHEHDGTLIWGPVDLPGAGEEAGGAPTIANVDSDPEPEIGVAGSTQYVVFEADGSVKWQTATQDGSSNMTGSTVFDLDGDGMFEVIYRDETALRIYRGEDGVALYELPLSSTTLNEQPVVADVDRDGNAEIVVTSDLAQIVSVPTRTRGLRVIGDANDNWVAARAAWNQHAYHIDNVAEDGFSVPANEAPGWLTHNTYRANVAPPTGAFASPDLSASRIAVDLSGYPEVTFTARVGSGGTVFAPAGVAVAFYDGDPSAGGVEIGRTATTVDLEPGEFEDLSVSITASGFGQAEVFVVVDAEDSQGECDELNNLHGITYDTSDVGLLLTLEDGTDAVQPGEL